MIDANADGLRDSWMETYAGLRAIARYPAELDDLDLVRGLDNGDREPARYVDDGVFGLHFLVRRGSEAAFIYYCPGEAIAENVSPYQHRAALMGLKTHNQDILGLRKLVVSPDIDDQPLFAGSHLAVTRRLRHYVPDFKQVRDRIPYPEMDDLTRNRSSLYLPLLVDIDGPCDGLLILQSAVPNFLGRHTLIHDSADAEPLVSAGLKPVANRAFFDEVDDVLFDTIEGAQEFALYARVLSQAAIFQEDAVAEEHLLLRKRISHAMRKACQFVNEPYSYMAQQHALATDAHGALNDSFSAMSAEDAQRAEVARQLTLGIELGAVFLDQMSLAPDIALDSVNSDEIMGGSDFHRFMELVDAKKDAIANTQKKRVTGRYESCCSAACPVGQPLEAYLAGTTDEVPRFAVSVRAGVVALAFFEMYKNASKYGHLNDDQNPSVFVSCGRCLKERATEIVRLTFDAEHTDLWFMKTVATDSEYAPGDDMLVVGVGDRSAIPRELRGVNLPNNFGMRQFAVLSKALAKKGHRCYLGYASLPSLAERAEKITFFLFPRPN